MTTCLILAAGNAERHNGGNKPLLKVNGETLLSRTDRLLSGRASKVILVTHREDLWFSDGKYPFIPEKRRWITETLLSARNVWNEDGSTIIALGDVYYTEHAADMMFDEDIRCAAFGKGCNIHGLRWNSRHHGKIASELRKAVERAEQHPNAYGAGKLWTFIASVEPQIPVIDFGDETTDFDSPQEHQRFIAKYGNRSTHSTGKAD